MACMDPREPTHWPQGVQGRKTAMKGPSPFAKGHERAERATSTPCQPHMAHPFPEAFKHTERERYGPIPSPRLTSTPNAHHDPRWNHNLKNGAATSKTALLPQNGPSRLKTDLTVSKSDPLPQK
ncbi:hypothetical protein PAXINDRAFT_12503 [Paxillus involutus ATCC 200175]|uniref:Uncharacterized protein n=1 Tax=Paxillus involutus ATCC 200175 TaxID=664439 RepID=A0A0C9TG99_PAXIN|nr:hypothetical protein PAXINDRAFT_12503 [Paxillus involutus ATCC 200175]